MVLPRRLWDGGTDVQLRYKKDDVFLSAPEDAHFVIVGMQSNCQDEAQVFRLTLASIRTSSVLTGPVPPERFIVRSSSGLLRERNSGTSAVYSSGMANVTYDRDCCADGASAFGLGTGTVSNDSLLFLIRTGSLMKLPPAKGLAVTAATSESHFRGCFDDDDDEDCQSEN